MKLLEAVKQPWDKVWAQTSGAKGTQVRTFNPSFSALCVPPLQATNPSFMHCDAPDSPHALRQRLKRFRLPDGAHVKLHRDEVSSFPKRLLSTLEGRRRRS